MSKSSADYLRAYETARRELRDLVASQELLERKKVSLRKTIETLGALCENEGLEIEPSHEVRSMIEKTSFADEIRALLKTQYPAWLRPRTLKEDLEKMAVRMSHYENPQARIQMILKRMAEANEVEEKVMPDDGKKAYRWMMNPVPKHKK